MVTTTTCFFTFSEKCFQSITLFRLMLSHAEIHQIEDKGNNKLCAWLHPVSHSYCLYQLIENLHDKAED